MWLSCVLTTLQPCLARRGRGHQGVGGETQQSPTAEFWLLPVFRDLEAKLCVEDAQRRCGNLQRDWRGSSRLAGGTPAGGGGGGRRSSLVVGRCPSPNWGGGSHEVRDHIPGLQGLRGEGSFPAAAAPCGLLSGPSIDFPVPHLEAQLLPPPQARGAPSLPHQGLCKLITLG